MKKTIEEQFPGLAIMTGIIEHNGVDYNRRWHENYVKLTIKNDSCLHLLVDVTHRKDEIALVDEVQLTFMGTDEREHLIKFFRMVIKELEASVPQNEDANITF